MKLLLTAAIAFCSVMYADTLTFNFEGAATTTGGALTTYTETHSGVTMTLTRPGSSFDITDLAGNAGVPASYGSRTLDPFANDTSNTPFIANFSALITSASISMGDFVPSDTDTILLEAFSGANGTGTLLSSDSVTCCDVGTGFVFTTVSVSAGTIGSLEFIGGSSDFPNSTYDDNIVVTTAVGAVPEPGSIVLLATMIGGAYFLRRRQGVSL
jgi:hypothetical protein